MVVVGDTAERVEQDPARPGGPPRFLSIVVTVVVAAGALAAAFVSREVVDDQKQRLLERRAAEASALISLSGGRLQEAFRSLSTVVQLSNSDGLAFSRAAAPAIAAELFESAALVEQDAAGYRLMTTEGPVLDLSTTLPGTVTAALDRAGADGSFVTSSVFSRGSDRRLGLAVLVPGLPVRTLVYAEASVLQPEESTGDRGSQTFGDLEGALYVGSRADPEQVAIITPGFDVGDRVESRPVQMGGDQWLLQVSPRESLVGELAERQPWMLLIGGLLLAGLVGILTEVLLRRRQYAMALVTERTSQLHASLKELDATQTQLVAQERLAAIGQLASAVGHELRNPLGVLSNVVYLLSSRLGRDDPWLDRQLRTAEREVAASTLIVSDLLQFAKPREPIFDEVDVGGLLDEVLSVVPPPPGIEVAPRWPVGLLMRADRDQLRQVLLNLVSNAYDAMPDGGLLVMEAERVDEGIRILVADTGGGIAEGAGEHLFEPFFTTKAKGIGLGLAVAHRIVEEHGGSLEFTSGAGSGTAFHVTVPAVSVVAPAAS